jgi:hypothetical protein
MTLPKQKRKSEKRTLKQIREDINAWADAQAKILQVNDKKWMERWHAARNPFEAWADWMTPEFVAIRAEIMGPYLEAMRAREAAKRGRFL